MMAAHVSAEGAEWGGLGVCWVRRELDLGGLALCEGWRVRAWGESWQKGA